MPPSEELFAKYKEIKSVLGFSYRGYDVSNIIATDLIAIVYGILPFRIKTLFKMFFKADLRSLEKYSSIKEAKVFLTFGLFNGRKDYYEILDYFRSSTGLSIYFDFAEVKNVFSLSPNNIVCAFKRVVLNKNIKLPLHRKIHLAAILTYRLNSIKALETVDLTSYQKYVAFSSVHPEEAMITQYFQKRGIKTFSLQHGLYHLHRDLKPVDVIAYENFNTDYHFCWGEFTKSEFIEYGIPAERLLIGGYPRVIRKSTPLKKAKENDKVLVFLARIQFDESNFSLLDILKIYQKNNPHVQFDFKLHPSLNCLKYRSMLDAFKGSVYGSEITITDLFTKDEYTMAIANNTSSYYEAYMYGIPCLRFQHSSFANGIGVLEDEFANLEEFKTRYSLLSGYKDESKISNRLRYVCGYRVNNYAKFV